eukprot:TRINITY_DN76085_c0_g1_i1.p1 TRINITY_DN76085_c0_g1~~TRINITY_DN76085_c0_g1_i1.p1  ORF type:complete len:566 (+),score=194.78 TRINITY_DN76085_c0_g1_i1:157-1854(+)
MSDAEDMPMGGMGGMDMDDDMSDEEPVMSSDLPEGITKEILTEAPTSSWKTPKKGDEVKVHYVGTLASDGSEFDSSRARGKPFEFTLGTGRVIEGWDLGVATMKKGEIAKLTIKPEFAYGATSPSENIPAKATLLFEVELLGWSSKEDLFGDEGVIKEEVSEGSGWKKPKTGDEVCFSFKATTSDGATVIAESEHIEGVVGSLELESIGNAVSKALTTMKKDEACKLKCSSAYAYGDKHPDGALVELTLRQIYETKDVSFEKNKTLMKKQVVEGSGWETPKDAAKVKLSVMAAKDGEGAALPGFAPKVLEFITGNGEVCDALEFAVAEMKKGEMAVLTSTRPTGCQEAQLGLAAINASTAVLTLELQEFVKEQDTYDMSEEDKVVFGKQRKEVGGNLFKQGRYALALERYKKVCDLFGYTDSYSDELKAQAKDLKKLCDLNRAACQLKLKDYIEAKKSCNTVLKDDSQNVKALFRRAQCELGLKNYQDCMRDVKKVLEVDPKNVEARKLYQEAQAGQKALDKENKSLYSKMCNALGKGPIPEPYKAKPEELDSEDEDMGIGPMGD